MDGISKLLSEKLFTKNDSSNEKSSSIHISSQMYVRKPSKKYHIAILSRNLIPALHNTIVKEFVDELNRQAPGMFLFSTFDGEGNEKIIVNQAKHIVQNYTTPYDAVFCAGALTLRTMTRVSKLYQAPIPIVFSHVLNPYQLGILHTTPSHSANICGIVSPDHDYKKYIDILCTIKKDTQKVLIPYNPEGAWLTQYAMEVRRLLALKNIPVKAIEVTKSDDVTHAIISNLREIDTVLMFKDDVVLAALPDVVNFSNEHGITVATSDLTSVEHGAAIGFSETSYQPARDAAHCMLTVFRDDAMPYEIPLKNGTTEYLVGFNAKTMAQQGVEKKDIESITSDTTQKIIFEGK